MDVAFILDNTGSMSDLPLTKLRNGIDALLDTIQAASGNDYRLALVTPDDDQVHVRLNFSENNREYFTNALNDPDLTNHGNYGNGEPESTDECLNTVVNALAESGRINPRTCNSQPSDPLQIEDFDPGFDREAMKLVVVITDHGPDGFCDDSYDGTMAAAYASQARTKCMKINAVQVDYHSDATEVMENYYQTSCGWYSQIPGDGTGIVEAVTWMLYAPGFPGNCNCP